jgi:flavodoxin
MKTLVVYYSNTGNNKYLAGKIANALKSDVEAITPRLNLFPFLILFSIVKTSLGIKTLSRKMNGYDRVIICGPIWMGQLISPLRDFVNKYSKIINKFYFVTCCGSSDAAKDGKFGYALVFNKVKNMLGDKCVLCEAFPIGLVLPDDKKENSDAMMKARLSDSNFSGEIQKRFEIFIQKVAE